MKLLKSFVLVATLAFTSFLLIKDNVVAAQNSPSRIGERPTLEEHTSQADIENGLIKFKKLLDLGELIFAARWTKIDGQGRPAATGNGAPTKRDPSHDPGFIQ